MPSTPDAAPVTVKDRENAARVFDDRARKASHPQVILLERHHAKVIRAGDGDDYDAVQAARYARLAATPSDRARVDGEVTQEDRDRALFVVSYSHGDDVPDDVADGYRNGGFDRHPITLAFRDCRQAAEQRALAAEKRTIPASDMADILETIQDAADDWRDQGYTSALAEVRDMAAIGRDVMERIADATKLDCQLAGWNPMDSPAEVVTDLLNMLHEAQIALAASEQRVRALVERLRTLTDAKALAGVRALVAGWNGEGRDDGPYERHPRKLGAALPETNCGAVYDLDEALEAARALLPAADGGSGEKTL